MIQFVRSYPRTMVYLLIVVTITLILEVLQAARVIG